LSCDSVAALGWLHVGARYYDPSSGRFVQRDPIGIRGGLNTYTYVSSQPLTVTDASGLHNDWSIGELPPGWKAGGINSPPIPPSGSTGPSGGGWPLTPSQIANQVAGQYTGQKSDKWMHFVVSCRITSETYGGFLLCLPGGLLNEIVVAFQENWGGFYDSFGDMLANCAGFAMGAGAAVGACNCEEEANKLGL